MATNPQRNSHFLQEEVLMLQEEILLLKCLKLGSLVDAPTSPPHGDGVRGLRLSRWLTLIGHKPTPSLRAKPASAR